MSDDQLKSLYELFDRLVGLPNSEQQTLIGQLQESNHPQIDSLLELLEVERQREKADSLFSQRLDKDSYQQWLQSTGKNQGSGGASDLRELVSCFRWDHESHHFFAGSYRIGKCLSFNSLGATYFAEDRTLGRNAVLFFPYLRSLASTNYRDNFLNSTKIISRIFHPNVATIFGIVEEGKLLGVSRQWIPGEDLESWLGKRGPLTPAQIALLIQRLAEGLSAIHDAKALHGDLKPANVIIPFGDSLTPVITDFGTLFARHIKGNTFLGSSVWQGGTPGYIAPEVSQDRELDERLDLYSLGQVLRKLLMQVTAEIDSEATNCLQCLADELTQENPNARPDTANLVIRRLVPISGRYENDVVNSRSFVAKRDLQSHLGLLTRRSVLVASATIVPFLLGRQTKAWFANRPTIKSHFIPGALEDALLPIEFKIPQTGVDLISLDDPRIKDLTVPETIYYADQEKFWGIKAAVRSVAVESEPLVLPQSAIHWNMVRIVVQCDAPPSEVCCELYVLPTTKDEQASRLSVDGINKQKWICLRRRENYFGGLTQRDLVGTIDPDLLAKCSELRFRVVLSTKRTWDGTGRPPIMLVVKALATDAVQAGSVCLWHRGEL
ncbi:MAG: Serine/threonine-protein kinase PknB [Planctomycetota bacterium]|jgi:serine/threonine protein kinase